MGGGLDKWLPELPEGASRDKTLEHTFLAEDGYWYSGEELEHYFKPAPLFGTTSGSYVSAVHSQMQAGFKALADQLTKEMYK